MNNYPRSSYSDQNPPDEIREATQPMQPPYPAEQQRLAADEPAPRRRHAGLWATLIVILLLLIAGGGAYYYFQVRSTPQKTLQTYCDSVKNNDALALYNTYSTQAREQTTVQRLQQGLRIVDLATGGMKSCSIDSNSIHENGSVATGTITFVSNRNRSFQDTVDLVDESGQWKVEHNVDLP